MPIRFRCSSCQQGISIGEHMAGLPIVCRTCGESLRVPGKKSSAGQRDDSDFDFDEEDEPRRFVSRKRAGTLDAPEHAPFINLWAVVGAAIGIGLLGMVVAVGAWLFRAARDAAPEAASGPAAQLFPVQSVRVPDFPDLPPGLKLFPSQVTFQLINLSLAPGNGTGPGEQMSLRIYLPPGEHAAGSLGCVLVAPAGTNLLCGSELGPRDYHAETLPYAEAGYVVVFYSLDGSVADLEHATAMQLRSGYDRFRAAQAGVVNGRNALEYVLAKLPQVDPGRIFCAGHSSAGTVSLLLAEHEPRLRGCIAYAPCSDVAEHLSDVTSAREFRTLFTELNDFVNQSNPRTHIAHLKSPLFLFHARDDGNIPYAMSASFESLCRQNQLNVEFATAEKGDHYQSMIDAGIPRAIDWLRRNFPAPNPAGSAPASQDPKVAQAEPGSSPDGSAATPGSSAFPHIPPFRPEFPKPQPIPGIRPEIPRLPAFPALPQIPGLPQPPFGNTRPGVPNPGGGSLTGARVIFQVLEWTGEGDALKAAREALAKIPWAVADQISYDAEQKQVIVPVRGSSFNTGSAKTLLEKAGFKIGGTQFRNR